MVKNENPFKSEFYTLVSTRIRDIRMSKGVKQDVLALQLNITRTSLINIEKGRQHPNLFMIFEIAFHLGISLEELLPNMNEFAKKYTTVNLSSEIIIDEEQTMGLTSVSDDVHNTVEEFFKILNKSNETGNNKS
jgi:DNA-binding XRE family transcriptional regulator